MNKEEIFVYNFETGKGGPQVFFNEILKSALEYRFKNELFGIIPPVVSPQTLTEAIFKVSFKDKLLLLGKQISGQRLLELFIASIYIKSLDRDHPNKTIIVAIPIKEESYDVAVYVAEKSAVKDMGHGKCRLSEHLMAYHIQIKEEFDFHASQENYNTLKDNVDVSSLENKSAKYDDLVLIFMRDYAIYNSTDTQSFLNKYKNVGLINMPSFEPNEIEIKGEGGEVRYLKLLEGKFNFLLHTQEIVIHTVFDEPPFLRRINPT
jgi:hypothetical protein